MTSRKRRLGTTLLAVAGPVLTLGLTAACGSGSGSGDATTINIGLTGKDAIFADLVVAQEQGYFKDANVKVNLLDQEASATTNGAAGRVDLVGSGTPSALPAAVHGRQTSIVYEWISGVGDAGIVVPPDSPAKSVLDLSGKRIITKGVGSGSYGAASTWSAYIVKHGGKPLQIVPVDSTGSMNAQLASGQVDAGTGSLTQYSASLSQNKLRLLVKPSSDLAYSVFPKAVAGNSYWGLKSTVQKKKTGVQRALSAVKKADAWINAHSVEEVVKVLENSEYLKGVDHEDITAGVTADKPFYAKTAGEITEQDWQTCLQAFEDYGLTVDLAAKEVQYDAIVDMSYLHAGAGSGT